MTDRYTTLFGITLALAISLAGACAYAQSLSDIDLMGLEQQSSKKDVQTHINPFTSSATTAENLAVEDLDITGIAYRTSDDAYALVSGYLVKVGDKIAGYNVDTIEKDRVVLKRLDETMVLSLSGGM